MATQTTNIIHAPGVHRFPAQPRLSDKRVELLLVYNPRPRIELMQYHAAPRLARWLEEQGGALDWQADDPGIDRQIVRFADPGIDRQIVRFADPETAAKVARELEELKSSRKRELMTREPEVHRVAPGLNLIGADRWRCLKSQSDISGLADLDEVCKIIGDKATSKGSSWSRLAVMVKGDGKHSGAKSGTGHPEVLDRLLEVHGLDDATIKAIEAQRVEVKRLGIKAA